MPKKTNTKKTSSTKTSASAKRNLGSAIEQAKKAAKPALDEIQDRIETLEDAEANPQPEAEKEETTPPTSETPARKRHVGPGGKRKAAPKTPKEPKAKKVSLLDAAAKYCEMHCLSDHTAKDMVAAAPSLGWKPGAGKTPEASLYAAIIREIAKGGDGCRFRKTAKGRFAAYNAEISVAAASDGRGM